MPPTNIKQGASSQASAYCERGTHTVSHQAEVLQVLSYLTVPERDVPHTQTGTHLQDVTNHFLPPARIDLENGYYSENLQGCYLSALEVFK